MAKNSNIRLIKGTSIPIEITQKIIDNSIPCQRKTCVQTQAAEVALRKQYGSGNYYIKSDSAGITFTVGGYRYEGAFDRAGNRNLYKFDRAHVKAIDTGKTEEEACSLARAVLKPYRSQFIIVKAKKIPPVATRERKDQINALRNKKNAALRAKGLEPKKYSYPNGSARELSL